MIVVDSLPWVAGPDAGAPIAIVPVLLSSDPLWRILCGGSLYGGEPVTPGSVEVDNTQNANNITLTMFGVPIFVSASQRSVLPMPGAVSFVDVAGSVTSGTAQLIFRRHQANASAVNWGAVRPLAQIGRFASY